MEASIIHYIVYAQNQEILVGSCIQMHFLKEEWNTLTIVREKMLLVPEVYFSLC